MPIKGTIQVQLSQAQAVEAARWLREEYRPDPAQQLVPAGWCNEQMAFARKIGAILAKAARRKRPSLTCELYLFREHARWLATFYKPGGWWDFGDGLQLPGQPAPEHIQGIAALALGAVSRHKGRPLLTLLDTVHQLERGANVADKRVLRRLRNETKPEREQEKRETAAAGPEPEA